MSSESTPEGELVEFYTRASAFFGEQLIAIGDEEWDLPTPSEWNVKALVAHVVVAEAQIPDVIDGRPYGASDVDITILGPDPVSVWRGTAVNALTAVAAADMDTEVDHPFGQIPLHRLVGFRITENLVHGWDLARTRGLDPDLPDDLAAFCLDFWMPLASNLSDSGVFAPMVDPRDESSTSRLVALLGRQR
ncbi:MAG: TIGR03086 family metal-binding protein [Acidimicrobiales bacterium]